MDPREGNSSEAAEGAAVDFAASSRSRRVHSPLKNSPQKASTSTSGIERCGGCRYCHGYMPCRKVNTSYDQNISVSVSETSNSSNNGMGGNMKKEDLRDKYLHLNRGDSFFEDDSVDYNCVQGDGQGESQSEDKHGEGGRLIRRGNDGPKFIDAPTPTLIDEDEFYEDEEMVKLEYERIRRNANAPIGSHSRRNNTSQNDHSHFISMGVNTNMNEEESVRRTPGAQMYRSNYDNNTNQNQGQSGDSQSHLERSNSFDRESMRRTPGPNKMHTSSLASVAVASPTKLPQDHNTTDPRASSAVAAATDASGLGFGLTLSSPIATGEQCVDHRRPPRTLREKDPRAGVSSRTTTTASSNTRRGSLDSPWSKAPQQKQQHHLGGDGRSVYSPNTLRLAEDMGNLLLEDDDNSDETQKISQFVFRSDASSASEDKHHEGSMPQLDNRTTSVPESWTTPFIVNMEQNQHTARVPRNAHGRGRKSRLDRIGRSRGGIDRIPSSSISSFSSSSTTWNQQQQRPGGNSFLPHAHQPTPLRKIQPQSFGGSNAGDRNGNSLNTTYNTAPQDISFVSGITGQGSSFVDYLGQQHGHGDINAPVLNFGGAFSPPAKATGSAPSIATQQQQRSFAPPPITGSFLGSSDHGNSGFDTSIQFPPFPTGTPAFGGSFSNQPQRHQIPTPPPYFQGSPAFGHSSTFQTVVPHFGDSGQHLHDQIFTSSSNHPRPIRQSPTFNFPLHPNAAYQMNTSTHHAPPLPPDFMVNVNVPHAQTQPTQQQPTQFIPNPQSWASNIPMQYEGMQPSSSLEQQYCSHVPSPYTNHGGWQMQQQYRMHPHQPLILRESQASSVSGTSTNTWNNPEGGQQLARTDGLQQGNAFNVGTVQHRTSFAPPAGRPPSRGKNQRKIKNVSRKWSNKNQQQKHDNANNNNEKGFQRVDSGPSVGGNTQGNVSTTAIGKKSSTSTKGGKKKQKDRSTPTQVERPLSTPVEEIAADQSNAVSSTSVTENIEDPVGAKRAELTESPATRSAFKDFYRKLRAEERSSFQDAEKFAMLSLKDGSLPESIHWRVYLELADLAKRSNRFEEARTLYQQVYKLQPYASQGWLEFSKLEEECGNMSACAKILSAGLEYCEYSENLLTRAIKHEEKRGNLCRAREFLSRLKHVGIEKVWRTVLEGAMLEARAGNDVMARRVLKYLMHHVPWYGPLYLEAYKLEKDLGHSKEALAVVERGLAAIPRYGPLWFGAFRLCEELDLEDKTYRLPQSMAMIDRATLSISKELIWKVHLEAAQMLERSSTENLDSSTDPTFLQVMEMSRKRFALTIISCPPNLRWKVWLAAGRMEVAAGNADIARRLFLRAHRVVPDKGRAVALLECARLEEFVGDVELASAILCRSRNVGGSDWKVWLESVMLAIRNGNYTKAIALSQKALQQHSGTGRLWASLIQLRHLADGEEAQFESLALALNAVPKSGEVWCEGARIHLNPFSRTFDLQRASRHLFFATKFTPQYGDGFLETLRLLILDQLLVPISTLIWEESKGQLHTNQDETWEEGLINYIFNILLELSSIRESVTRDEISTRESIPTKSLLGNSSTQVIIERLHSGSSLRFIDMSRLELRCANADPNYGPLWFHCRSGPTETARNVLARAVNLIVDEVKTRAYLYIVASIRRLAVISRLHEKETLNLKEGTSSWEKKIDQELLAAPSLKVMIKRGTENTNIRVELSESSIPASNFIAGIAELSQHHPIQKLTLSERRKMLFGADSLFS
jgi:tetratricopeptide (TPR) repeat protein